MAAVKNGRSNSRISNFTEHSVVSVRSEDTLSASLLSLKLRQNPFDRTLSTVESFEHVRRTNRLPDYHVKIVVVGDGAVGKTCLLMSYVERGFPTQYVPTIFENYVTNLYGPKGQMIELALWDTAGQEEYNRLRPLSYTGADILMVCYAVDSQDSLDNVEKTWFPEVKHFCPGTPIMLVGLKSDLYESSDDHLEMVDPAHADDIAKKNGAFIHIQCSAKKNDKVDAVFYSAINNILAEFLTSQDSNPSILKNIFKSKKLKLSTPVDLDDKDETINEESDSEESSKNIATVTNNVVRKSIRKSKCIIM
ncbi:GTP-binding protein RHO4 [Nakaseomyces bracarensis]|uniref:GTP-binding protein RHO4 n=1 Tax=Nakaseomyces bracarensis TaxID=273131 RepID=A0ABR4P0P2_9SACH